MAVQFDRKTLLENTLKAIDEVFYQTRNLSEAVKLLKDIIEAANLELKTMELEPEERPKPDEWKNQRPSIKMINELKKYGILPADNLTKYDCWGLLKFLYKYPALKIIQDNGKEGGE